VYTHTHTHTHTHPERGWREPGGARTHIRNTSLYIYNIYMCIHTHTHTHIQNGDGAGLVAHELILGTRDFLDRLERAVAPKPEELGTASV
jgi:hypothetical protein